MLVVLHPVLVTFLMTFTSAEVKIEFPDTAMSVRQLDLDGKVSNEHLLFLADTSFELDCGSTCMKHNPSCFAFSVSPKDPLTKKMTCRGHSTMCISRSSMVEVPGSKTYFMTDRPSGSTWLERPCTEDSDCPATVSSVTCFADAGQCLCQPGYYYSHCRDDCVADCAPQDLQPTFLKYPNHAIPDRNIVVISNCGTIEEGREHCLSHSNCLSVDIQSNTCYPQEATALSPGASLQSYTNPPADYYQRTCL